MSEYNLPNEISNENLNEIQSAQQKRPNYLKALFVGLGASVIVAIILAIIAYVSEQEYYLALIFGAIAVGVVIHYFVPNNSIVGALLGAVLCPSTYLIYQFIMVMLGYYYVDSEDRFWWILGGSVLFGAYYGYKGNNDNND